MAIRCENSFCAYWDENECIFEDIELNALGSCMTCTLIDLTDEEAVRKRQEMLERFEKYHRESLAYEKKRS